MPLYFAHLADQQQSLTLDLTDPLFRDPEFFADFPQRVFLAVHHAGAHSQDVRHPVLQVEKLGLAETVQRGERQRIWIGHGLVRWRKRICLLQHGEAKTGLAKPEAVVLPSAACLSACDRASSTLPERCSSVLLWPSPFHLVPWLGQAGRSLAFCN